MEFSILRKLNFTIYCKKNERTSCRLTEQIHNEIKRFNRFDSGTQYKLAAECGLGRGNIQLSGMVGLSSESKISGWNFLVDLTAQSTSCDRQLPIQFFTKFFRLKNGWISTPNQIINMKEVMISSYYLKSLRIPYTGKKS